MLWAILGRIVPSLNSPLSWGVSATRLCMSPWAHSIPEPTSQTAPRSVQPFWQNSRSCPTDRQTGRPRYRVRSNIHSILRCAWRCGLIAAKSKVHSGHSHVPTCSVTCCELHSGADVRGREGKCPWTRRHGCPTPRLAEPQQQQQQQRSFALMTTMMIMINTMMRKMA